MRSALGQHKKPNLVPVPVGEYDLFPMRADRPKFTWNRIKAAVHLVTSTFKVVYVAFAHEDQIRVRAWTITNDTDGFSREFP